MLDSLTVRAATAIAVLVVLAALRLLSILPCVRPTRPAARRPGAQAHLLVVLGSGGHTTEMLSLIRDLDPQRYARRTYVVSSADAISVARAHEFEEKLAAAAGVAALHGGYTITTVHRARRIHQPIYTAPFSSARCLVDALAVLRADVPDVILTNGPATGVIVVLAALMLKCCGLASARNTMRTIYVESFARVESLSLSGRILLHLVDRFVVQWETLRGVSRRAEWRGFLVR